MGMGTMKRLASIAGCLCVAMALGVGTHAQAATSTGENSGANPIEWSIDMNCTASCHNVQAETMAGKVAQGAQAHGGLPCVSCHADEEGLAKGHAKVTADDTKSPKRLKKSEVPSEACLTCHQATDGVVPSRAWTAEESVQDTKGDASKTVEDKVEGSAGKTGTPAYSSSTTADIDYLVDINGTTVNPHRLPINKSHATIGCATCHMMHDDTPLEETAVEACIRCHHDNVYECFTCHD